MIHQNVAFSLVCPFGTEVLFNKRARVFYGGYIKNTNEQAYFYIKNANWTDSVVPVLKVYALELFH